MVALLVVGWLPAYSQGTIVYRTGAEMISNLTRVNVNLDGTIDFDFHNRDTGLGEFAFRSYSLSPNSPLPIFPDYAGEVLMNTTLPLEVEWHAGQPILPVPTPGTQWTGGRLDMQFMLAAVRIRAGEVWHYGWLRFEVVGQDSLGDLWGLRDGAYNSIPNASINMLQVPEPATWAMIAGGLAMLAFNNHRRRDL